MKKELFTLGHVALYAKGWYQRSSDVVADMKQCLRGTYEVDCMTKRDVAQVILNALLRSDFGKTHTMMEPQRLIEDIAPNNCHTVGYYHRETPLPIWCGVMPDVEYDYWTAVIHLCLSRLLMAESGECKMCIPDFKNVLPNNRQGESDRKDMKRAKAMFENV